MEVNFIYFEKDELMKYSILDYHLQLASSQQ